MRRQREASAEGPNDTCCAGRDGPGRLHPIPRRPAQAVTRHADTSPGALGELPASLLAISVIVSNANRSPETFTGEPVETNPPVSCLIAGVPNGTHPILNPVEMRLVG